jgi:hypothetical protein
MNTVGALKGQFSLFNEWGDEVKTDSLDFVQQIGRFANVSDPYSSDPPRAPIGWLVTQTGAAQVDWRSPGGDQAWRGMLRIFLTNSVEFDPDRALTAINYIHDPKARVIRQDPDLPFEPLPVILSLGGMHTGEDSQSTYGVSNVKARIEARKVPSYAPPSAALRPSIQAELGVWGDDATLASIYFQVTINAEYGI